MDFLKTPIAELEKALGFDPAALCIFCEQPVGTLSMGGALVCPACDCGHYRNDHPDKWKRGKAWGVDASLFYANARKRLAESNPSSETAPHEVTSGHVDMKHRAKGDHET